LFADTEIISGGMAMRNILILFLCSIPLLAGCTSVGPFPTIARAGDTLSVMVGGTENARKETIDVTLQGSNGQIWDLKALGKVRSVFNLRMDGRAYGYHYSPYLDMYITWSNGHEPVQTVLVADLPPDVPTGYAYLTISKHVTDNSSGATDPFTVRVEIIGGVGMANKFSRRDAFLGSVPADFSRLEPAPHAKIGFGSSGQIIGAASLVVSFNSSVLSPSDINVYVPESTVRGSVDTAGSFGDTQRMVYWRKDASRLYLDVVAPQGIDSKYLQLFLVHPRGLMGSVNFSIVSAVVYDTNGNAISNVPVLTYSP
jgi:hypothetical protein